LSFLPSLTLPLPSFLLFPYTTLFRSYQVVRSKMAKTSVMLKDPGLARYIPETVFYSRANLERMLNQHKHVYVKPDCGRGGNKVIDRKSTRLNSSHVKISYAVFCLKKK